MLRSANSTSTPVSAEHLTYAMLGLVDAYALRERMSIRHLADLTAIAVLGATIR
jgi:hypothetical protein